MGRRYEVWSGLSYVLPSRRRSSALFCRVWVRRTADDKSDSQLLSWSGDWLDGLFSTFSRCRDSSYAQIAVLFRAPTCSCWESIQLASIFIIRSIHGLTFNLMFPVQVPCNNASVIFVLSALHDLWFVVGVSGSTFHAGWVATRSWG